MYPRRRHRHQDERGNGPQRRRRTQLQFVPIFLHHRRGRNGRHEISRPLPNQSTQIHGQGRSLRRHGGQQQGGGGQNGHNGHNGQDGRGGGRDHPHVGGMARASFSSSSNTSSCGGGRHHVDVCGTHHPSPQCWKPNLSKFRSESAKTTQKEKEKNWQTLWQRRDPRSRLLPPRHMQPPWTVRVRPRQCVLGR